MAHADQLLNTAHGRVPTQCEPAQGTYRRQQRDRTIRPEQAFIYLHLLCKALLETQKNVRKYLTTT